MAAPIKTYHVIPVLQDPEKTCQFKTVQAHNSREAAKKAIGLFAETVSAFQVWNPQKRNCEHIYLVRDIKNEWHGIPFGD